MVNSNFNFQGDNFYSTPVDTSNIDLSEDTFTSQGVDMVKSVMHRFKEDFPNTVPMPFIIEYTIKYIFETISRELINKKTVTVEGFGKFFLTSKYSDKINTTQYYPKFRFSRSLVATLRSELDTATISDKRYIEARENYKKYIQDKRERYYISTKGFIPESYYRNKNNSDTKTNNRIKNLKLRKS